jgi:hypothetical protein
MLTFSALQVVKVGSAFAPDVPKMIITMINTNGPHKALSAPGGRINDVIQ